MKHRHFVWFKGNWVPVDRYARPSQPAGPLVIRDIEPYKSMVTGERIPGRRQHRDHLRAHGCIEVGNEFKVPERPKPRNVEADVKRVYDKMTGSL